MDFDCPSVEALAAFVDGSVFEDRPSIEEHLASCEVCRATVVLSIRSAESGESAESEQMKQSYEAAVRKVRFHCNPPIPDLLSG